MNKTCTRICLNIVIIFVLAHFMYLPIGAQVSKEVLDSISTPDQVVTSIGTLTFLDGAPYPETAKRVYDYLDTMRGVDAFLKGMPGASLQGLIKGAHSQGAVKCHQVILFDKLMDSQSLYLTGNTSTLYVLAEPRSRAGWSDGPRGAAGHARRLQRRLVPLRPGHRSRRSGQGTGRQIPRPSRLATKATMPEGYFVVRPRTYDVWVFMRASIAKGLDAAARRTWWRTCVIYPLARKADPPKMKFISGSGKAFNTIHANDYTFYEHLEHEVIQKEPLDMLDPETRGLFASIGMEKGKPFQPDERMKKILTDAVAIANAAARSIVWYPRVDGTMKGIEIYPDTHSAWLMGWVDKNVFFTGKDGKTMNSDARVMFHYPYTAVTPAMAVTQSRCGLGLRHRLRRLPEACLWTDPRPTSCTSPPILPPRDFWALTMYDNQTRSHAPDEPEVPDRRQPDQRPQAK